MKTQEKEESTEKQDAQLAHKKKKEHPCCATEGGPIVPPARALDPTLVLIAMVVVAGF